MKSGFRRERALLTRSQLLGMCHLLIIIATTKCLMCKALNAFKVVACGLLTTTLRSGYY